MANPDYEIETSHRLYNNKEGVCLEIRPHPDFPELWQLHTPNKKSEEWYGHVNISFSRDHLESFKELITKALEEDYDR